MNDTFIKACKGEKTDYTPVWLMRQAGRFLDEFQETRKKANFLEMCKTPELAAEITMQPVDVLGVDAAIFFSDILTTVEPMGMVLDYDDSKGPSYLNPIKRQADVDKLIVPDPEDTISYVYEAQKILVRELKVPLIGFAGAPFTVVSYMIEGASSASLFKTKDMAFGNPALFYTLMEKVSRFTAEYLKAQAKAGANALMLFDSFAGALGPGDYQIYNLPYVKSIIAEIKDAGVPIIYFGFNAHASLPEIAQCGADVIGIDYNQNLDTAISQLGQGVTVQGNMEPYMLVQPRDRMVARAREILDQGKSARAHIFNLGHGVPVTTPPDNARALVEAVHEYSKK